MSEITGIWHDEQERWIRTGRLDQGPCWCDDCLPFVAADENERSP